MPSVPEPLDRCGAQELLELRVGRGFRLRQAGTGLEACDGEQPPIRSGTDPRDLCELPTVRQNRDADVDIGASLESVKARWRDAGDGEWIGIEPDQCGQ